MSQKRIIFGETSVPVPDAVTSVEQARGFAAAFLPGLSDSEGFINEDGDYEFRKKAGTKG
jgi:hypothetical protein